MASKEQVNDCLDKLNNAAPAYKKREFSVLNDGKDNPIEPVLGLCFANLEDENKFYGVVQTKQTDVEHERDYFSVDCDSDDFDDDEWQNFICLKLSTYTRHWHLEVVDSRIFGTEKYLPSFDGVYACNVAFWNELLSNKYICEAVVIEPWSKGKYIEHSFFFDGVDADEVQPLSFRRESDEMTNSPLWQFLYFVHCDVLNEQYVWTFIRNREMHPLKGGNHRYLW